LEMNKKNIITLVFLTVSGLLVLGYFFLPKDTPLSQKQTMAIPNSVTEKVTFIHEQLNSKELALLEKFEETDGIRTTEWKEFSVKFTKSVRELPKSFVKELQYDEEAAKNNLVEKIIVQNQQLLFLWREMNTSLLGEPAKLDLAKSELQKAKESVKSLLAKG